MIIKTLRNNCTAKRKCGTSANAAATMICANNDALKLTLEMIP